MSRYTENVPLWRPPVAKGLLPEVVTVALACGHDTDYPEPAPTADQPAWCYRCREYVRVRRENADA